MSKLGNYIDDVKKPLIKRYVEVYEDDYFYIINLLKNVEGKNFAKYIRELVKQDVKETKEEGGD